MGIPKRKQTTEENMDVFVGSLWHQYCDPFATVYATSRAKAQAALDENAEEEWTSLLRDCDCPDCEHEELCDSEDCECESECCDNDIMTSGVFQEELTEDELIAAANWTHSEAYRLQDFYKDGYEYGVY